MDTSSSLAYDYTQDTTIHGIARATRKDKALLKRIFWLLLFLTCLGLFLYFLCQAFIKYRSYPVSTRVTHNNHDQLDFPSVTICNYNKLLAHDPGTVPNVDDLGVALQPGTAAYVAITRNEMVDLPYPFTRRNETCIDTAASDFVNPLLYHDTYSYFACIDEDITKTLLLHCGCANYLYSVPGVKVCNLYEAETCGLETIGAYYKNTTHPDCPRPCHSIQYDMSVSQAQFPNRYVVEEFKKKYNVSEEILRENFVLVHVYFRELGSTKVEQLPGYTALSALAEIGGYMGLCLGASILTLFEAMELLTDCVMLCMCKRKKTTQVGVEMVADSSQ